ncbi:hypothetical protein [Paraburkholderia sp. BR14374]|uniref:hypothetical protein n=1 Tax=Paraburkholderia sp. BR14374 TaxID=3237007 RepID=UPI0034CDA5CD
MGRLIGLNDIAASASTRGKIMACRASQALRASYGSMTYSKSTLKHRQTPNSRQIGAFMPSGEH